MTESSIQDAIHTLYEGDTDTPSSTDEEYLARRRLINAAIDRWESYENTDWSELFVSLADAADGDTTLVDGTSAYDCPSDFKRIVGFVRTSDGDSSTYYAAKRNVEDQLYDNSTDTPNFYYVTGNPSDGYKINLHPTPDSGNAGDTISYEYFKEATEISATTDTPEMNDPYFVVYFVLSRLFRNDGRHGEATEARMDAENRLKNMKTRNMTKGWFQNETIPDRHFAQGVGGFGT